VGVLFARFCEARQRGDHGVHHQAEPSLYFPQLVLRLLCHVRSILLMRKSTSNFLKPAMTSPFFAPLSLTQSTSEYKSVVIRLTSSIFFLYVSASSLVFARINSSAMALNSVGSSRGMGICLKLSHVSIYPC